MSTFDRDARELAKDAIAFYSRYANPLLLDALIDAARWAVGVTEGGELWAEKPCDHGRLESHGEFFVDEYGGRHYKPSTCPGGSRERVWPEEAK